MKKLLIATILLTPLLFFAYTIPFPWFQVEMGMSRTDVYELCGTPASTDLWDIKGERWDKDGPLIHWIMYVGFKNEVVSLHDVLLDIGPERYELRINVLWNDEWLLRM